jgi:predicted nucleotidyltransferase
LGKNDALDKIFIKTYHKSMDILTDKMSNRETSGTITELDMTADNTGLAANSCKLRYSPETIEHIKSLILSSVEAGIIKRIYLFGSYAYGEPNENSDIDLCVVIENSIDEHKIYMKAAKVLCANDIVPCDLLVYTEKDLFNFKNPKGVENTIITKGKILYG